MAMKISCSKKRWYFTQYWRTSLCAGYYKVDRHGDSPSIGALVILLTKNSQRLGDLAAGTMVIRLNDYRKIQVSLDEFSYLDRHYKPVYPQAENLSLIRLMLSSVRLTLTTVRTVNGESHHSQLRSVPSSLSQMSQQQTKNSYTLSFVITNIIALKFV